MISLHIYGCRPEIYERAKEIGISDHHIHTDDRPNGGTPLYVAKKAWLTPTEEGETYRCVLQDDVKVCDGFYDKLNQLVERQPTGIFSLFPLAFLKRTDIGNEKLNSGRWIIPTTCVSGCAVMMPVDYIHDCWANAKEGEEADDERAIIEYLMKSKCGLYTTLPSIVQHIGTECLIKSATTNLHGNIRTPYFIDELTKT